MFMRSDDSPAITYAQRYAFLFYGRLHFAPLSSNLIYSKDSHVEHTCVIYLLRLFHKLQNIQNKPCVGNTEHVETRTTTQVC